MKDGLISWKKKLDKYDEEYVGDDTEISGPRLTDTMGEPTFVMRDEFNANTMKKLRIKW